MFIRLLLTAMISTILAFAQGGGGMGDDMSSMPRVQRQTPFDIFAERLKLNRDQKTEAQTVLADAMKESEPLRQQLTKSREAIVNAMLGGASEDDLKKIMDAHASVVAQVTGIEAKAFAKVCATLKPNQQGKAASAFEAMAGMFNATSGAGERRGRN